MSMEKKKEWQVELFMEKLRTKANHLKSLTLNESAKVLKMTLMERRFGSDTAEKAQFQKCLDVLQTSIKITSLQAMVERLESVSRQLGLKFTAGPSGVDWFISSDMFYLEVLLETTGQVKDVKIQHEGKAEQQSCPDIVECLAEGDFAAFSGHLEGLASIYQINADKKMKAKSFMALGALESDLVMLSQLQSNVINETTNLVHKSPVGILQKRKGGYSVKLTYFVSPYDLLDLESSSSLPLTVEAITQRNLGYHVTVGIEGASSHKLQVTSLVAAQRGPDGKAFPSVSPFTASNSTTLPAWFVLRLGQPMPVCLSLVRKLQEFTNLEFGDLSQAQPLFSLLTSHVSNGSLDCANNRGLFVTLPDQQHCYFLTESPELQGLLLSSIPYTHPTHVAHILNVLRQQALFNTLISSCVRPLSKPDLENAIAFEVSALSVSSISICFEHPNDEGMCTVDLDLTDIASIKARLYSAYATEDNAICSEEYISKVVQHCQSIPVTMRALLRKAQAQAQWRKEDPVCELGLDGYSATRHEDGPNLFPNDFARLGDQNSLRDPLPSLQYDQHNHKSSYDDLQSDLFPITPSLNDLLDRKSQDDPRASTQLKKPTLARFKSEPGRSQRADSDFLLHSPASSDIGSYSLPPNVNSPYELNRPGSTCSIGSTGTNLIAAHSRRHSIDTGYLKTDTELEDMDLDSEAKEGVAGAATAESGDPPTGYNVGSLSVNVSKDRQAGGASSSNSSNKKDDSSGKGDKALFPSVSITPVSPSFNPSLSSNYPSLNLERRPGIEIIPLSASPASNTLPSSLTITPVTLKSGEKKDKEKFKEFKVKESKVYDVEDSRKEEKKERKRKREEMLTGGKPAKMLNTMAAMMGPPPQMLVKATAGGGASGSGDKSLKSDSVSRLPNLSIKPSVPSPLASPTSAPGGGALTFMNSSLSLNSPTCKKATSPSLSFPPLKPAKSFTAISPKHSTTPPSSSPKHSISSSPKHHPSSGKPSMSALKSAASPSLPKTSPAAPGSLSPTKSKHKRDKDKKSSTPTPEGKPKPVLTKTKSFELPSDLEDDDEDSEVSAIIGQGGASTENLLALLDNSLPEGASPTEAMRHSSNELSKSPIRAAGKKISLSAVVDKLRMSQQSDGTGPAGTPAPGEEGKEEKKEGKEGEKKKEGGAKGSGEFVVKQSSQGIKLTINKTKKDEGKSSKHSSSEGGGAARNSSVSTLKSSTGSSSSSKKTSSSPSRPESASKSRPPSSSPKTVSSAEKRDKDKLKEKIRDKYGNSLARSSSSSALDAKKAENKFKQDLENEKVFKMLLAQSKLDKKFQIPKLPKPGDNKERSDREKAEKIKEEKEKEEKRRSEEARSEEKPELEREDRGEHEGKLDTNKDRPKSLPILSSNPPTNTDKSGPVEEETFKLFDEINKAKTKMEAPPNRPSPATTPRPPSTLSGGGGAPMPPLSFPASPAVSVHILKSPAPMNSPLAVISPHSLISQASPCVIDDDLMDEALVGLGK